MNNNKDRVFKISLNMSGHSFLAKSLFGSSEGSECHETVPSAVSDPRTGEKRFFQDDISKF